MINNKEKKKYFCQTNKKKVTLQLHTVPLQQKIIYCDIGCVLGPGTKQIFFYNLR